MESNQGARWEYIEALETYMKDLFGEDIRIAIISTRFTNRLHIRFPGKKSGLHIHETPISVDTTEDDILERVIKVFEAWKLVPIKDHVKNS